MTSELHSLKLENFKRFQSLTVQLTPHPRLILGRNGSGKTQILWAIIMFVAAFNSRTEESSHRGKPFLFPELGDLLGAAYFVQCRDYSSFVNDNHDGDSARISATFAGTTALDGKGEEIVLFEIFVNGNLTLRDTVPDRHLLKPQIRFAFVGLSYDFGNPSSEKRVVNVDGDMLCSTRQICRELYRLLPLADQHAVIGHIKHLFNDVSALELSPDSTTILVYLGGKKPLDVALTGSAFQKVLATFIFLYSLKGIQGPATQRIFLMEEPEALLYPSLASAYFSLLDTVASAAHIHLIATTNSDHILSQYMTTAIGLSPNSPSVLPSTDSFDEISRIIT